MLNVCLQFVSCQQLHTDLAVSQDRLKELSLENVQLKESIQTGLQKLSSEKELRAEMQDSAHRHSQQIARAKVMCSLYICTSILGMSSASVYVHMLHTYICTVLCGD